MKSIFRFFVEHHLIAILMTVMIFLLGFNTLMTIKRDSYPNVDYGHMTVGTIYPGASPEDVEINVTNKIEKELKSVTGIKDIVSISMENTSGIQIVIDSNVRDEDKVKMNIREAVNRVVDLPPEVRDAPLVEEVNTSLIPVIEVGITGDVPYRELYDYARIFEKKLRAIPEVSRLSKFGYRAREVQIEVFPHKIRTLDTSLTEIIHAIQRRNIRSTAGTYESFTTEEDIVTLAEFEDPQEVGDVIVRSTFDGPLIKISDLAIIRDDFEEASTLTRINGRNAISFLIYKKESADVIRTSEAVKALVEGQNQYLPENIQLSLATDYSHYVQNRFQVVVANALMGLVMVLILLTIFLNGRAAFWVAMGIPVSLLGAVFLMPAFDAFLDSLTLSAMVMVIGIIVDDAIIVGENVFRHHQLGKNPVDAAVDGISEVFWPVVTTIMTTLCAFAPMFFMPGIFGKFVFVIPLVISLALIVSLVEVVVALPAHLSVSLNKKAIPFDKDWFQKLRTVFEKFLRLCLRFKGVVLLLFALMAGGTVWLAGEKMNFVLFPSKMAEEIYLSVELPKGTMLKNTAAKLEEIEAVLKQLPESELASYVTRIGQDFYYEIESENHAYIIISLTPFTKRTRTAVEIRDWLRQRTDQLEGFKKVLYYVETGGPPTGKPINLYVVGHDDAMRTQLTTEIVQLLEGVEGVKDIERGDQLGKNQIKIKPDYERLARLGLTVSDIARHSRIAIDGEIVTSVRYDNEDVDFRVVNDYRSRQNPKYLEELSIPNAQGKLIKLSSVVEFERGTSYSHFQHYDGERGITIYADVDKDKITPLEVMNQIEAKFDLDRDWPGMRLIKGGEIFETEKSIGSLARAFIIAIIAIYFLLIMLFQSVFQPLMVILAIPFGLLGVIWAFLLHGEPLSFLGMMGVIGLSGVVVNDSLVLVNHINLLRKNKPDAPLLEIVVEGASDRLRAIIMTSLTTIVGLLPLAYGLGGADPFVAPMALALGFGIFFATPLTLIILPCFYLIGHKSSHGRKE